MQHREKRLRSLKHREKNLRNMQHRKKRLRGRQDKMELEKPACIESDEAGVGQNRWKDESYRGTNESHRF